MAEMDLDTLRRKLAAIPPPREVVVEDVRRMSAAWDALDEGDRGGWAVAMAFLLPGIIAAMEESALSSGAVEYYANRADRFEREFSGAMDDVQRLRGIVQGWPDKLVTAADWLDLLDGALDALQESANAELRAKWAAARGPLGSDHSEIQRDLREFAGRIRRELGQEPEEGRDG